MSLASEKMREIFFFAFATAAAARELIVDERLRELDEELRYSILFTHNSIADWINTQAELKRLKRSVNEIKKDRCFMTRKGYGHLRKEFAHRRGGLK